MSIKRNKTLYIPQVSVEITSSKMQPFYIESN